MKIAHGLRDHVIEPDTIKGKYYTCKNFFLINKEPKEKLAQGIQFIKTLSNFGKIFAIVLNLNYLSILYISIYTKRLE